MDNKYVNRFITGVYKDSEIMCRLFDAFSEEIYLLRKSVDRFFRNQFIETSDHIGLKQYEWFLGLSSVDIDVGIEARRQNIQDLFVLRNSLTEKDLLETLHKIFNKDEVEYTLSTDDLTLFIDFNVSDANRSQNVISKIRQLVPANILLYQNVVEPYTWRYLQKNYTWSDLMGFTWEDLSQYATPKVTFGQLNIMTFGELNNLTFSYF